MLTKLTDQVKNICRIGQEHNTCKYLVIGTEGFECMKSTPERKGIIDRNWATTVHSAQGDNCAGTNDFSILNS